MPSKVAILDAKERYATSMDAAHRQAPPGCRAIGPADDKLTDPSRPTRVEANAPGFHSEAGRYD